MLKNPFITALRLLAVTAVLIAVNISTSSATSPDYCTLIYSDDFGRYTAAALSRKEVKERFDFHLLCDDLKASMDETQSILNTVSNKISIKFIQYFRDWLIVYNVSKTVGYGVYINRSIPKGTVVAEYVGVRRGNSDDDGEYAVVTNTGWTRDRKAGLGIDNQNIDPRYAVIDAKREGNIARFINHCPDFHEDKNILTANLEMGFLPQTKNGSIWKVVLVAAKDIKAKTPLCFDYGNLYKSSNSVLFNSTSFEPINASSYEKTYIERIGEWLFGQNPQPKKPEL